MNQFTLKKGCTELFLFPHIAEFENVVIPAVDEVGQKIGENYLLVIDTAFKKFHCWRTVAGCAARDKKNYKMA